MASPAVGGGRRGDDACPSGSAGCPTGDGRRRRGPAASPPAGECGVKDQVSRTPLTCPIHPHRPTRRTGHPCSSTDQRSRGGETVDVVITHGRKIVSDEVRALTEEKVRHIGEHCPGLERAEVHFSEEHNPRIPDRECCEVVMSGHGHTHPGQGRRAGPADRRRPGGREAGAPDRADQGPDRGSVAATPPAGTHRDPLPQGAHGLSDPGGRPGAPDGRPGPGRRTAAACGAAGRGRRQ